MGNCIPFAPKVTECPVQKLSHTKCDLPTFNLLGFFIESASERLRVQSQLNHLLVESQLVFCLILFGFCPHPATLITQTKVQYQHTDEQQEKHKPVAKSQSLSHVIR